MGTDETQIMNAKEVIAKLEELPVGSGTVLCRACGAPADEVRNINLYVIGSEGLNVCHDCEMQIVEFCRSMIRTATKARMAGYRACKSTERKPGENWKMACPKHDAAVNICCTSVDEGIQSAKRANLDDLELAFRFENGRKGSRKSLVLAIVREIKKRRKAAQIQPGGSR